MPTPSDELYSACLEYYQNDALDTLTDIPILEQAYTQFDESTRLEDIAVALEGLTRLEPMLTKSTPVELALLGFAGQLSVAGTHLRYTEVTPALEGYVDTQVSMESVKSYVVALWKTISDLVQRGIATIMKFLSDYFNRYKTAMAVLDQIEDKLKAMSTTDLIPADRPLSTPSRVRDAFKLKGVALTTGHDIATALAQFVPYSRFYLTNFPQRMADFYRDMNNMVKMAGRRPELGLIGANRVFKETVMQTVPIRLGLIRKTEHHRQTLQQDIYTSPLLIGDMTIEIVCPVTNGVPSYKKGSDNFILDASGYQQTSFQLIASDIDVTPDETHGVIKSMHVNDALALCTELKKLAENIILFDDAHGFEDYKRRVEEMRESSEQLASQDFSAGKDGANDNKCVSAMLQYNRVMARYSTSAISKMSAQTIRLLHAGIFVLRAVV